MERVKDKLFSDNNVLIKELPDIYSGEETLQFDNRHPIYKTLMKLEFEDVLRSFTRK